MIETSANSNFMGNFQFHNDFQSEIYHEDEEEKHQRSSSSLIKIFTLFSYVTARNFY